MIHQLPPWTNAWEAYERKFVWSKASSINCCICHWDLNNKQLKFKMIFTSLKNEKKTTFIANVTKSSCEIVKILLKHPIVNYGNWNPWRGLLACVTYGRQNRDYVTTLSDCFSQKPPWVGFANIVVSYFYIGTQFYQNDASVLHNIT